MSDLAKREPTEAQAKAAHDVSRRIKTRIHEMRVMWLRLAEDLYAYNINELWRDEGYSSFEAFLREPDVEIERRQAYYLLEMWRELVVKRSVDPKQLEGIGQSKVQEVLPAIRRGYVDIPDALAACETLTRDDLRREFSSAGGNGSAATGPAGVGAPAAADHSIDPEAEPEYALCEACGSMYRVKR